MGYLRESFNQIMQKPTLGRIVHYRDRRGRTFAAVITVVHGTGGNLNLSCFRPYCQQNDLPVFIVTSVPHSPSPQNGHWSWPLKDEHANAGT